MSKLTDKTLKNLKAKATAYKLADGGGLYIHLFPSGAKYWRMAYYFAKRQQTIALGVYPDVSLAKARQKRETVRADIRDGNDPSAKRRQEKHESQTKNTFQALAVEWANKQKGLWVAGHYKRIMSNLEKDIMPTLGNRRIDKITTPDLLAVVRRIESRGALDIAKRALQICAQIFRYAVITGRAERNPAMELSGGGALKTRKVEHRRALPLAELPDLWQALKCYDGHVQTRLAMRLIVLTFTRTGELLQAKWQEINTAKGEWRIPAARMKMNEEHIIPLSQQAAECFAELRKINGDSDYIFPSPNNRNKPVCNNLLIAALRRMGLINRATIHGFRATASTALNEAGYKPDWIERQLAHGERNAIRAAYNHAEYLSDRRRMMQAWADMADGKEQKAPQAQAPQLAIM